MWNIVATDTYGGIRRTNCFCGHPYRKGCHLLDALDHDSSHHNSGRRKCCLLLGTFVSPIPSEDAGSHDYDSSFGHPSSRIAVCCHFVALVGAWIGASQFHVFSMPRLLCLFVHLVSRILWGFCPARQGNTTNREAME